MQIQLFQLDSTSNQPLCTLSEGQHILGRGDLLNCNDKRISRNHLSLLVEINNITLTLIHHTNPCYLKNSQNKQLALLKPNVSVPISDNDTFGFFPDNHWYRIKVATVQAETSTPTNSEINENVVIKTEPSEDEIPHTQETVFTANEEIATDNISPVKVESVSTQETVVATSEEIATDNLGTVKVEAESNNASGHASTSTNVEETSCSNKDVKTECKPKKEFRDRCWYGTACYRKNPEHKAKYSHFGDADYDTDPEDNRPSCSYGRSCYRRNGIHRKEYKHSAQAQQAMKNTRKRNNAAATLNHNKRQRTTNGIEYSDSEIDEPLDALDLFYSDEDEDYHADDFEEDDDEIENDDFEEE